MIALLFLFACAPSDTTTCTEDAEILVDGALPLTCADGKIPARYIRVLVGRRLVSGSLKSSVEAVRARYQADPEATRIWLNDLQSRARAIEQTEGLPGAELRSSEIWTLVREQGPIRPSDAVLWNLQDRSLSVWATDDEEKLALTETDIEGWIRFASLGNEIKGRGVLTVSIANKAKVYRMAKDRFIQGDRAEKIALTSLGVVWPQITKRWKAASYAQQQEVIRSARWPPTQSTTSLAFLEAIIEDDLVTNAAVLHRNLGPLHFRDGEGYFREDGP